MLCTILGTSLVESGLKAVSKFFYIMVLLEWNKMVGVCIVGC